MLENGICREKKATPKELGTAYFWQNDDLLHQYHPLSCREVARMNPVEIDPAGHISPIPSDFLITSFSLTLNQNGHHLTHYIENFKFCL